MDIRAIVVIGGAAACNGSGSPETISGVPIAYVDVLGGSVVQRVLQRLRRCGISAITLVDDVTSEATPFAPAVVSGLEVPHVRAASGQLWQAAEEAFLRHVEDGADLVVTLRLGPYAEVDYEALIQHHIDKRCAVTTARDRSGAGVDVFVLNASARVDAAILFQSALQRLRRECEDFTVAGYVNRLRNAADVRRLGVDGLLKANEIRPEGTELKPGVWVGKFARIHRKARVIAPAFIGAQAKVHASALITRCSILEHHTEVDCGTVVEDSTVLSFTRVGAGLDVMHSVVGFRRLAHLRQNVEVEIADEKFVGMVPLNAVSRLAGSTAALFAFIPTQIYRGFFAPSQRKSAAQMPETLEAVKAAVEDSVLEVPASGAETSEFPANLAVARRYGDQ